MNTAAGGADPQRGRLVTCPAGDWTGHELGTRSVAYEERDAILYALAVGASASDLDLVFERRLRVLPTFATTLAQWAPDALGASGAFDTATAVHGAQRLLLRAPLPPRGAVTMSARVANVWDKGAAAVFEVTVDSEFFTATWSIFAPGCGGFGGDRGPSRPPGPHRPADERFDLPTQANQAALYRLSGDRHGMHIDPDAAVAAGQPRPFLHGLCTLASAVRRLAAGLGAHPADLVELEGRFTGPVFPGDALGVEVWSEAAETVFTVTRHEHAVISGGRARFTNW